MNQSLFKSVEGIVVRKQSYAEAHRILELITPTYGKLSIIAYGAKSSKKNWGAVCDHFTRAEFTLKPQKGLWRLEQAIVLDAHLGLRTDLEAMQKAALFAELTQKLTPEEQENREVYALFSQALRLLSTGSISEAILSFPKLLEAYGIASAKVLYEGVEATSAEQAKRVEEKSIQWVERYLGQSLKSKKLF